METILEGTGLTAKGSCLIQELDPFIKSLRDLIDSDRNSIEIDLDRYNKRIEARVQYTLTGIVLCSRCAQEIQTEYSGAESLLFDPSMDTQEEEIELQGEDLDIGWYEDGKLDIPTVICEAIVLSFPQRIHCKMDIVQIPASGDCYTPPEKEERTLENMFADLLKKQ